MLMTRICGVQAALKEQPGAGRPGNQHESIPMHTAAMKPGSAHCTDSGNASSDGGEAVSEVWHAALERQLTEASPAVQLSGCWTEARPGMPSAVTRSQLRAPAWRPAGGAAPGQLQSCEPARDRSAVEHAPILHPLSSHSNRGSKDAEGAGAYAVSCCLDAGVSRSPELRMPELATAGHAGLPSSSTSFEREQMPFFTPVAALQKTEPLRPQASRPANLSRLRVASTCYGSPSQDGRLHAMADEQSQHEALCWEASDSRLMPGQALGSSPCGSSSADVSSSKEGSSSHQESQEALSGQEVTVPPGSSSIHPCKALSGDDGPACSSSRGNWETDVAEWGSPRSCPMPSDSRWPSVSDSSELQQAPTGRQGPEESLQSASSSVGECMTPDSAGRNSLLQSHDIDRGWAGPLLEETASSQPADQQGALRLEEGHSESSHASCRAARTPDGDSMPSPAPGQQPLPLGSASTAHSRITQHASARHLPPASLRGSGGPEGLAGPSSGHGSRAGASAGQGASSSRFWEAPAGALPGQATQSPLPCRPGIETVAGASAARQACLQPREGQPVSGAHAHVLK